MTKRVRFIQVLDKVHAVALQAGKVFSFIRLGGDGRITDMIKG